PGPRQRAGDRAHRAVPHPGVALPEVVGPSAGAHHGDGRAVQAADDPGPRHRLRAGGRRDEARDGAAPQLSQSLVTSARNAIVASSTARLRPTQIELELVVESGEEA